MKVKINGRRLVQVNTERNTKLEAVKMTIQRRDKTIDPVINFQFLANFFEQKLQTTDQESLQRHHGPPALFFKSVPIVISIHISSLVN